MSRRLVNRSGAPAARPSGSRAAASTTTLPDYETPSCPLDESARRALGELSGNRTAVGAYSKELRTVVRSLGSSVGDLHERLQDARGRLASLREKREAKGEREKTAEEQRLEAHVPDLQKDVDELTLKSERAVRDAIDHQAELEDEGAVLRDLYTNAAIENGDRGEGESPEPASSTVDAYRDGRARKLAEYTALSMHQRYALNNDYIGFKKLWHGAMAGEDGPPLPDASRWFRADGEPVMTTLGGNADDDEASDEDIAVAREVLSRNCPLTLRPLEEPYSNRKCTHTFEKSAILEYLAGRDMQCPQTGCSQTFSGAKFDEDFYLDQAMLRRIERAKQAQDDQDMDDDEEEDDVDGDSELAVCSHKRRRTKTPKRERERA